MGELSAVKVIRYIRTPRSLPLAAFVAGFDLEGVGETIMDKVIAAGFDTLEKLRSASVEELSAVYGLGEITARTIAVGLNETAAEMDRVLSAGIIGIAPPPPADAVPLRGKSFCFTGELVSMKRSEAEEKIKALGASAKTSVVKDLSFLVTNNPESGSAKNRKARDLGVAIIDEKQFLDLLKNSGNGSAGVKKAEQGELF
jgi:DNA ligase (NAD+)